MSDIPWWVWAIGFVVAVVWWLRRLMARVDARIVAAYARHLKQHPRGIEFVAVRDRMLTLRHEAHGESDVPLRPLIQMAVRAGRPGSPEWETAFRVYTDQALAMAGREAIGPADAARLRPRLVTAEALAQQSKLRELPSRPIESLGLTVVYVLDEPLTVLYVTRELAEKLELDDEALHARAIANLAPTALTEAAHGAAAGHTVTKVNEHDGHDAARLLAIPGLLAEGQAVVAVVPDKNSLALFPEVADLTPIRQLAAAEPPGGPRLLDRPVRVTRDGFELL